MSPFAPFCKREGYCDRHLVVEIDRSFGELHGSAFRAVVSPALYKLERAICDFRKNLKGMPVKVAQKRLASADSMGAAELLNEMLSEFPEPSEDDQMSWSS